MVEPCKIFHHSLSVPASHELHDVWWDLEHNTSDCRDVDALPRSYKHIHVTFKHVTVWRHRCSWPVPLQHSTPTLLSARAEIMSTGLTPAHWWRHYRQEVTNLGRVIGGGLIGRCASLVSSLQHRLSRLSHPSAPSTLPSTSCAPSAALWSELVFGRDARLARTRRWRGWRWEEEEPQATKPPQQLKKLELSNRLNNWTSRWNCDVNALTYHSCIGHFKIVKNPDEFDA